MLARSATASVRRFPASPLSKKYDVADVKPANAVATIAASIMGRAYVPFPAGPSRRAVRIPRPAAAPTFAIRTANE